MMEFIDSNISQIAHLESTLHNLAKICSMAKSVDEVLVAVNADMDLEHRSNKFVFETLKFQQSCDMYMRRLKPRVEYMPKCCESYKLELKSRYRLGIMLIDIKRHQEGVRIANEFLRNNSIHAAALVDRMSAKQKELGMFLLREDLEDDLTRVEHRQLRELSQAQEACWLAEQLNLAFYYKPL